MFKIKDRKKIKKEGTDNENKKTLKNSQNQVSNPKTKTSTNTNSNMKSSKIKLDLINKSKSKIELEVTKKKGATKKVKLTNINKKNKIFENKSIQEFENEGKKMNCTKNYFTQKNGLKKYFIFFLGILENKN